MSNIFRRAKAFTIRSTHFIQKAGRGAHYIANEFFENTRNIVGNIDGTSVVNTTLTASAFLGGESIGTSNQTGDLTAATSYANIIGDGFGTANSLGSILALGTLLGDIAGGTTNSAYISGVGTLIGDSSGGISSSATMLAIANIIGNSSSGGGITSDELYNAKLSIVEVISKLKLLTNTGVGYNISGSNGTNSATSLEIENLESEIIGELNKLKIRLIH